MKTLLFLYLGGGILLALLAIPLLARKIGPNPFYGFRVKKTLEDPNTWYEVNQYFARRQMAVGVLTAVFSAGLYSWPGIGLDGYALACLGVFVLAFGLAMAQGIRFLRKQQEK